MDQRRDRGQHDDRHDPALHRHRGWQPERPLYIERPMDSSGPGGVWSYVDIIGGYMNHGAVQQDPENYFMIDELKIDDHYIGPPAGFNAQSQATAASAVK